MPLIDPEDYPTTSRGYRHPPDDVGGLNVANDVPADVTRLAEDINDDVDSVVAAAAAGAAAVAGDLTDHEGTTTNVHGITNTAALVTTARSVTAGAGLTGGGTLAADRTLSIANGGVGTAQIADDAITTGKIAPGAVGTTDLADSSVTDGKLAGSITPSKVTGTAVVQARTVATTGSLTGGGDLSANRTLDVVDGGIGTTELADAAVTTVKIADGAITLAKLDAGTTFVPEATVGNLLPLNVANGSESGTVTGVAWRNTFATVDSSTASASHGIRSLLVTKPVDTSGNPFIAVGSSTTGAVTAATNITAAAPVIGGQPYTILADLWSPVGLEIAIGLRIFWRLADGTTAAAVASAESTQIATTTTPTLRSYTAVAPADAVTGFAQIGRLTNSTGFGSFYADRISFHRGAGGVWTPPGSTVTGLGTRANPADNTQVQIWNPGNSTWITV
jgi:hypothetical protein